MTTATLRATPNPAGDSATGIRIRRAVNQPGAKGKKGFLLWAVGAFPPAIVGPIIQAAASHLDPRMIAASQSAAGGPAAGSLGRTARTMGAYRGAPYVRRFNPLRGFGDTDPTLANITVDPTSVSDSTSAAVINATDSSAADPSWLSSVSSAISAVGQAYLTKTQIDASQQIFNTNLQRAQQGLPPIPTNPTAYGLPAPTVNFGLASGTLTPVLYVVGGIGLLMVIGSLVGKRSKK
jgi:hypothetical protein